MKQVTSFSQACQAFGILYNQVGCPKNDNFYLFFYFLGFGLTDQVLSRLRIISRSAYNGVTMVLLVLLIATNIKITTGHSGVTGTAVPASQFFS